MTMTRALMIQGTASNAGKSFLVAGLCRLYARRGLSVRPFKPQNMSNNAAVAAVADANGEKWGEIGRAQALQARAAKVAPNSDMNPVLLKPQAENSAALILNGLPRGNFSAAEWISARPQWRRHVLDAFARLSNDADLVVVEGAGSPAETNLRHGDLANMGFADAADVPVVLVGDIERGGVIAQLVGTHALLSENERARVVGFCINKFHGDPKLFTDGAAEITRRTRWQMRALFPWCDAARRLPPEDSLALDGGGGQHAGDGRAIVVHVPRLPRLANADDLDPLRFQPKVVLRVVPLEQPLTAGADLVFLPGSKAVRQDLAALRASGRDLELRRWAAEGGAVVGVCGGYQMLGREIIDADGVEGEAGASEGLGLLPVVTRLAREKVVLEASGCEAESGLAVSGYEIHNGRTEPVGAAAPFLSLGGVAAGQRAGRIFGCYLHGLFAADEFRRGFLSRLFPDARLPATEFESLVERALDDCADFLEEHINADEWLDLARRPAQSAD
ncbi:MAG: cobyric acid synthase [Alphaproteobacteria bacterium]|nr:cobyric acid synthase [Alphaproteobacteria bacterium]